MTTIAKVASLPKCDFCGDTAKYDFKTVRGPWAYGCEEDYLAWRFYTELGTGKGQMLEVAK